MRYIFVHQQVLEEPSQLLYSSFLGVIGQIEKLEESLGENLLLGSLLQLELGYTYLLYSEVQKAKFHFEKANEVVGFRCEWTGKINFLNNIFQFKYFSNRRGVGKEDSLSTNPAASADNQSTWYHPFVLE